MATPLTEVERRLWAAADDLRANSKLKSSEYSVPVLELIFLRFRLQILDFRLLCTAFQRALALTPMRIAQFQLVYVSGEQSTYTRAA